MGFEDTLLGNPFSSGKRKRNRGRAYDEQRAEIYDDQGNLILDEQGYTPVMPGRYVARAAQYESERFVAKRNAQIRADALHALKGGLGLLSSYRPGGAAALTSPYFANMANVLMNSQIETPDLLANVRRAAQASAAKRARTAQALQIAGTAVGAIFGGPAGAAIGGALGSAAAPAAVPSSVTEPASASDAYGGGPGMVADPGTSGGVPGTSAPPSVLGEPATMGGAGAGQQQPQGRGRKQVGGAPGALGLPGQEQQGGITGQQQRGGAGAGGGPGAAGGGPQGGPGAMSGGAGGMAGGGGMEVAVMQATQLMVTEELAEDGFWDRALHGTYELEALLDTW